MVKKAHLVTGKGGVGKSLFSVVLARYFGTKTPSVLLTELTERSFYKDYLSLPDISYRPTPWASGVDISQWSPDDCLKEYSLYLLKIESLYKLFFENPVSKSLIQVAPGLHELALLGKLTSSPRRHGPPMPYDEIVVDSYSTGHFLSLLRAPGALAEAIPFGPMGDQSRSIDRLIRDPNFTEVHLVTLPEELPVTETIELFKQLKSEFGIQARVYLNKMYQLKNEDLTGLLAAEKESFQFIMESENTAKEQLKAAGIKFVELPLITSLETSILIEKLLAELKRLAL